VRKITTARAHTDTHTHTHTHTHVFLKHVPQLRVETASQFAPVSWILTPNLYRSSVLSVLPLLSSPAYSYPLSISVPFFLQVLLLLYLVPYFALSSVSHLYFFTSLSTFLHYFVSVSHTDFTQRQLYQQSMTSLFTQSCDRS
jgi:hypothetical protein